MRDKQRKTEEPASGGAGERFTTRPSQSAVLSKPQAVRLTPPPPGSPGLLAAQRSPVLQSPPPQLLSPHLLPQRQPLHASDLSAQCTFGAAVSRPVVGGRSQPLWAAELGHFAAAALPSFDQDCSNDAVVPGFEPLSPISLADAPWLSAFRPTAVIRRKQPLWRVHRALGPAAAAASVAAASAESTAAYLADAAALDAEMQCGADTVGTACLSGCKRRVNGEDRPRAS